MAWCQEPHVILRKFCGPATNMNANVPYAKASELRRNSVTRYSILHSDPHDMLSLYLPIYHLQRGVHLAIDCCYVWICLRGARDLREELEEPEEWRAKGREFFEQDKFDHAARYTEVMSLTSSNWTRVFGACRVPYCLRSRMRGTVRASTSQEVALFTGLANTWSGRPGLLIVLRCATEQFLHL